MRIRGKEETALAQGKQAAATVRVDGANVRHVDFLGVGVNVIPVALMANNAANGYQAAHWEVDLRRILSLRPKVARVWFQVDWMEPVKGVYDWERPQMQAFRAYMDAFREAGTEIELNFGWKVGRGIQKWFSIEGCEGRISAPRDLEAYAASCSAALRELIDRRGYDNIKYIAFYNEPNGHWDFDAPGDPREYYAKLLKTVHERLVADGLRERVRIWGPEEVDMTWTLYMKDHADAWIDEYTFHIYGGSYEDLGDQIAKRRDYVAPKPVGMTEFGWPHAEESGWDAGYANYVIQAANEGLHSALIWQLNGVRCEDPDEGVNTNGVFTLWDSVSDSLAPNRSFYIASLLMRYIPPHSEVLATSVSAPDVRASAFRSAKGDVTVVVECKDGARGVALEFAGAPVEGTFYKYVYTDGIAPEDNALLPPCAGRFAADGGGFADEAAAGPGYAVAVYTTLPPQPQVEVTPAQASTSAGRTVRLAARVVDGEGGVRWSVVGEGNGTVNAEGLYTAPEEIAAPRLVAVKAEIASGSAGYGVALISVLP